jgi:post-segregation antitoxin (ccd killing protein)
MLTGCSKGAHVVVDYDSVNALKQKDLSIATTADAAFKE